MKRKAKYIFIFFITTLFLLFIALYITQAFGYYEFESSKKKTLTENAIKRFESDLKSGKKLNAKDYLEEEKNYNNNLTRASLKISSAIEKGFDFFMNSLFNEMNKITTS